MVDGTSKEESLLETKISKLPPFCEAKEGDQKKAEDQGLIGEVLRIMHFSDHIQDKTVRQGLEWYMHKQLKRGLDPDTRLPQKQPDGMMEEYAHKTVTHLAQHKKYATAYYIAKLMSYASKCVGVILVGGAGRNLMTKLKETNFAPEAEMDPLDHIQLFDFMVKAALLGTYQIVRAAPDHTEEELAYTQKLHGWHYAQHVVTEMPKAVAAAAHEPFTNRHNAYMLGAYVVFDGLMNIPGHVLCSGRPVHESEAIMQKMEQGLADAGHEILTDAAQAKTVLVDNVLGRLPFAKKYLGHREQITRELSNLLPDHIDYGSIIGTATQQVAAGYENMTPEERHSALEHLSSGYAETGTHRGLRKDMFHKVNEHIKRGEGANMTTICGGVLEVLTAGIDAMGIYAGLARGDIFEDAARRAAAEMTWKNYVKITQYHEEPTPELVK